MLRFLRDGALGKTVIGRAKKKISAVRLAGYINQLYHFILFSKKDLDKIEMVDMEAFIETLETNRIPSRTIRCQGNKRVTVSSTLSPRYRVDIKVTIRKFYKWLWGNNKVYPELVEWIDTFEEKKEIPALTEVEVERMLDRCKTSLQRVIIQVLFDGGFRLGELLNIRLHHVRFLNFDPKDQTKRCFFLRAPYSKTTPRTVALPMHASTRWLSMWLEDHPAKPKILSDGTIDAVDTSMQLFPMTANAVRMIVRRAGTVALGKRVYPHLLRHTSATYWSNKLPYFKFCKRFGWTMTSNMPQRYIDQQGIDEMDVAKIYHDNNSTEQTYDNKQYLEELNHMISSRIR